MRRALLIALLCLLPPVVPWASAGARAATSPALTLDAPERADSGLPFVARVCVDAPADVRVVLRAPDAAPSGRYAPWSAGCRDVALQPDDIEGDVVVDARVRDQPALTRVIALARPDLPERALRIVAVYGPPFSGAVVENTGERIAPLGGLTLAGATVPNATLAPHERIFLGASAPPDVARALTMSVAVKGNFTLSRSRLVIDTVPLPPKLAPAEYADRDGAHRDGMTRMSDVQLAITGAATAYATPDAGAAPVVELLDGAQREVLVEAYTLTSVEIAAALARALDRGANVSLLMEGSPVGGVPPEERGVLAALEARGATVRMLGGDASFPVRYQTLHAKTMVVDRASVLVATENLRATSYPAEAGALGTRGYGLIVRNATMLAAVFGRVFDADFAPWPDARPPEPGEPPADLAARRIVPASSASPPAAGPRLDITLDAANVTPVFAPETSWAQLAFINGSRERIDAEQLFAQTRAPFLDALVAAARRGVAVRVLLDGRDDNGQNAAAARMLNALAAREILPLEARVDTPMRTLHAKLVLVDGRAAYVGSMNWGVASATKNRESGLIVESDALALWWEGWFEKDWSGPQAATSSAPRVRSTTPDAGPVWVLAISCLAASASRSRWRARS